MTGPIAVSGGDFARDRPQLTSDGARTWIVRASNFVVAHSEVDAGAVLRRDDPDEYMLLVPSGLMVAITAGGERLRTTGQSLVVVPPGPSEVQVAGPGAISRMLSWQAEDLIALASNADHYRDRSELVGPLEPWPVPPDGFRLRCYRLDDHAEQPGVLGRIFRCTNLMVNVFAPWSVPRDPRRLTPHSHDNFEQCSLTLTGEFVHQVRYPWGADMTAWRDDDHIRVTSPGAVVFPPTVVHTSQSVGEGDDWQIVDVFAPPRHDFSEQPGFVRNAADYPMPS
jgi:hypothetical protein